MFYSKEIIMGLEKIVLNAIKSADTEIAENASFFNGTLFIEGAARAEDPISGMRLYRILNAIRSVVNCNVECHEAGDDIVIDFI
jgi:hypothetical protein